MTIGHNDGRATGLTRSLLDAYVVARSALEAVLAGAPEQPGFLAEMWLAECLRDLPGSRRLWDAAARPPRVDLAGDTPARDDTGRGAGDAGKGTERDRPGAEDDGRLAGGMAQAALDWFESLCDGAWERLGESERRELGQVYTPPDVVDIVLDDIGYTGDTPARLIDPASGTGVFLGRAARRIARAELDARQAAVRILHELAGVEIRDEICGLARLRLGLEVIRLLGSAGALRELADLPAPALICADALDPALLSLDRRRIRPRAFRWVVGNPPYLEAKRADEGAKARWRARFAGRLEGAFDLYVCFLELALELAAPDGDIGLVIPNKFMVNRYARKVRSRLLRSRPPRTLRDLSHLPIFRDTGVYPIILHLGPERAGAMPGEPGAATVVASDASEGSRADAGVCLAVGPDGSRSEISLAAFAATGPAATFFIPADPALGSLLARLLQPAMPRLGSHLRFRSTVSFHRKGLREQYVSPGIGPGKLPYLGGKSWMRRKEVAPFRVEWDGFGIRYAADELAAIGNPLPPVELFLAPKIVFCQHARRLMAFWDGTGRFVTKDVYPIALAPDGHPDPASYTAAWTALLNTRLLTVLYGALFRGICIGGGYYHYLPAFLEQVPCPEIPEDALAALAALTRSAQAGHGDLDWLEDLACDLFGLTSGETAAVDRAFLAWASNHDPVTDRQLAAARPLVLK